jgi:hypothetical protein
VPAPKADKKAAVPPAGAKDKAAAQKPAVKKIVGKGSKRIAPKKQTLKVKSLEEKGKTKQSRKTPAVLPDIIKKGAVDGGKKLKTKRVKSLHIEARQRKFHIGGDLKPNRGLSRMVKWPAYIRLQRRKKIMYERLKIPAMVNQFSQVCIVSFASLY